MWQVTFWLGSAIARVITVMAANEEVAVAMAKVQMDGAYSHWRAVALRD